MGAWTSPVFGWWKESGELVPTWIESTQEVYILQAPNSKIFCSPNIYTVSELPTMSSSGQSHAGSSIHNLQPLWQCETAVWALFVLKELIKWGPIVPDIHLRLLLPRLCFPVLPCRLPPVPTKRGYEWPAAGPNNNLMEWSFIKTVLMATIVSGTEEQPRGFWFSPIFLTSIYKAELSSGNPENRTK